MENGSVKWFDAKKGYGFITSEAGKDYFVHYSSINMTGFKKLEQGQKVTFEVKEDPKGNSAANVQLAE